MLLILFLSVISAPIHAEELRVRLSWKPVEGVKGYKIQVSRDSRFRKVLIEGETTAPEWLWSYDSSDATSGRRVYYRVASISRKNVAGIFSVAKEVPLSDGAIEAVPAIAVATNAVSAPDSTPTASWRNTWAPSASVFAGLGAQAQGSSESDLKGVSVAPYFQQKVGLSLDLLRHDETSGKDQRWQAIAEFQPALFRGQQEPRVFDQTRMGTFFLRVDVVGWRMPEVPSSWRLGWGATVDHSFRWYKTGIESVDTRGALSVGPSLYLAKDEDFHGWAAPVQLGARLSLPLTGVLTGGQIGARAKAWGEWRLSETAAAQIHLRIEGEAQYDRWASPQGTGVFAWTFWLAPTFRLRGI
jgi:hypothetical protein